MKTARMCLSVALMLVAGQQALGHDGPAGHHDHANRDQLRIAVQQICPVSGQRLGEHGAPIKVKVGEETVFLCCQGCLQQKINPQHWATIHTNMARAQKICPVMKRPLPKNPKWTIAEGQVVYTCCPPCGKKILAKPDTYLHKVDELYASSLQSR